tara:strand:- start:10 stop:567 length:558 start_codon:yes stop_codon:yes gene_type:complete
MLYDYLAGDKDINSKVLVEVGTTREAVSGQDSTKYFYNISNELGFKFITVDMDEENSRNVESRFPNISAVTMKGEDYLKEYQGMIDYVYLDAFDFYHSQHPQYRKDKYRDILNCEINNESCHKMHLECCESLINKMPTGGIILFDDVLNPQYDGKGKTAIPFLLENNFNVVRYHPGVRGCLLVKQ